MGPEISPCAPQISVWRGHPSSVNCSVTHGSGQVWVQPSPGAAGTTGRLRQAGLLGRGPKALLTTAHCGPPPGASAARKVSPRACPRSDLWSPSRWGSSSLSLSFRDFHSVLLIRHLAYTSLRWRVLICLGVCVTVTYFEDMTRFSVSVSLSIVPYTSVMLPRSC